MSDDNYYNNDDNGQYNYNFEEMRERVRMIYDRPRNSNNTNGNNMAYERPNMEKMKRRKNLIPVYMVTQTKNDRRLKFIETVAALTVSSALSVFIITIAWKIIRSIFLKRQMYHENNASSSSIIDPFEIYNKNKSNNELDKSNKKAIYKIDKDDIRKLVLPGARIANASEMEEISHNSIPLSASEKAFLTQAGVSKEDINKPIKYTWHKNINNNNNGINEPFVIITYARWCGYCKSLANMLKYKQVNIPTFVIESSELPIEYEKAIPGYPFIHYYHPSYKNYELKNISTNEFLDKMTQDVQK